MVMLRPRVLLMERLLYIRTKTTAAYDYDDAESNEGSGMNEDGKKKDGDGSCRTYRFSWRMQFPNGLDNMPKAVPEDSSVTKEEA